MKIRTLKILLAAFLILVGGSCVRRPKGVKSDSDMLPVVTDMALADTYLRTLGGNSSEQREAMTEYVLDKYGLTRAEYDSTMIWYARNADAYYDFMEKVDKEMAKKHLKLKGSLSTDVVESNDLWPYPRMAVISPLGVYDGFNFSVASADVEPGQRLKFKMRLNNSIDGEVLFGVEYENGTKGYQTTSLRGSRFEMVMQTDTARKVKRIFGNLMTDREVKRTIWLDSISLAAMPFDSTMYYQIHSQRRYREPQRRVPKEKKDTVAADSVSDKAANLKSI